MNLFKDEAKYAYAVGVIRSLEANLLSMDQMEDMLASRDIEGVLKMLGETEYAHYINKGGNYEAALVSRLENLLQLLSRLSIDPFMTDLFFLKYDLYNLKIILKARVAGEGSDLLQPLFLNLGKTPAERLKKAVFEESYSDLPPLLKRGVLEALSAFERSKDLQVIDNILDRGFYPLFSKRAGEAGSLFLTRYFEMVIDLININNLIRLKWRGDNEGALQGVLLDNGSIPGGFYISIFDYPWEAVSSKFFATPYENIVEHGLAHLVNYKSFDRFEILRDNLLFTYLRRARLFTFGIEPLVAYFLIKEKEIEIIRMIIMARLNALPVETIRERLAFIRG